MDEAAAQRAFAKALDEQQPKFGEFFLAKLLGLSFDYSDRKCRITFELKDFMFNPQGSLHGGVIATVMDISMGHLLNHHLGPGTTLEMKTQYIKAARQGTLRCTGEFIKMGQGISYLSSTLVDGENEVIAFATSTWKRLKQA